MPPRTLRKNRHGVKTGDDSAEISDNENGWHNPSAKLQMQMLQWQLPFFGNVQTKIVKSLLQTEMAPVNAFMPPMIPLLPPQPQAKHRTNGTGLRKADRDRNGQPRKNSAGASVRTHHAVWTPCQMRWRLLCSAPHLVFGPSSVLTHRTAHA